MRQGIAVPQRFGLYAVDRAAKFATRPDNAIRIGKARAIGLRIGLKHPRNARGIAPAMEI